MDILQRFRDPISGLTHLAGALLGIVGVLHILGLDLSARPSPQSLASVISLLIYGFSLIFLYSASSAYHLCRVTDARRLQLRQLDHAMVPVFIAGSYTPFCVIALHDRLGYTLLAVVWTLAVAGLVKGIYWLHAPRWVTASVFVAMGWVVVVAVYPLSQVISPTALSLLFGGGLAYSLGALIYACKWPNPLPPLFGFHEIWHLFVLLGSACHYVSILTLV